MQQISPAEALALALERAGTDAALAEHLGISREAVNQWKRKKKRAPVERVLAIEGFTGVSRHLLRPDIYPRESTRKRASR